MEDAKETMFTEEFRKTLDRAREVAYRNKDKYIELEHVLYVLPENPEVTSVFAGTSPSPVPIVFPKLGLSMVFLFPLRS